MGHGLGYPCEKSLLVGDFSLFRSRKYYILKDYRQRPPRFDTGGLFVTIEAASRGDRPLKKIRPRGSHITLEAETLEEGYMIRAGREDGEILQPPT